ncbi:MAG: argininosuccinate lyase [Spirochaetales bacterium]|nr:MAG: argininosuccinate lyase [Spirochaetales bacterium]
MPGVLKLWETSPSGLDTRVEAFLSSLSVDSRLLEIDLEGSAAHVAMLGASGVIPGSHSEALTRTLSAMLAEARSGSLKPDASAEDVHSFIEQELTRRLGDAGKSVHAGRSRNDQVALDMRLYLRSAFREAGGGILDAISALCDLAAENVETYMPSYTHLRRAQPSTLAFHLLAWCAALERDRGRFIDAAARANECPLGSAAVVGSGLPLDRDAVARALGFSRPSRNAMDATADRDACVEYAAAASTLIMHLSRFCEEIILWSSAEFGFMDIANACSTGSSIMPQKRNPDVAELIRGKTGRVFGSLVSLLTIQKGLPLGYDRDLQEDKAAVFDLSDTLAGVLPAFVALVQALKPKPEAMEAALEAGFAEATDIAELLVAKGVPFRDAYGATKAAIAAAAAKGVNLASLGDDELATASDAFSLAGIKASELAGFVQPAACVARRDLVGGPAPVRVREEIARLYGFINEDGAP